MVHNEAGHGEPAYYGPERRLVAPLTQDRVALMIEEAVDKRLSTMESKLMAHIDSKFNDIHKVFTDHVEETFPPGPLHKHKAYHEGRIKSAEASEKIKFDLIGWGLKGSLMMVFMLVGWGALEWLKRELSK